MKVSIVIVHHNDTEYLKLLLQSIKINSINYNLDITLIDNASTIEDSIEYINLIEKNTNIKIVRNDKNLQYVNGLESGFGYTDGDSDYIVFAHSDNIILHPQWIDVFDSYYKSQENVGCISVGPPVNYITQQQEYLSGPGYHFLFLSRNLFDKIDRFEGNIFKHAAFSLFLQHKLNKINKQTLVLTGMNFIHHYNINSIAYEERKKDLILYNNYIIERI